ncbi:MAG TPA: YlcI/YnfO family protein [Solirubrobacteraceae bacterium]|nr:YlcI/YnfO family protein [Solirubrobacteraceae bacterium]
MQLDPYVDKLREQLALAASAGGDEAQSLAQRLTAALESAVRLTLLDALSAASAEITSELAPGSVELRLRGGEPEFVVAVPPAETAGEQTDSQELTAGRAAGAAAATAGDGGTARINLRLPDQLKSQVEQSADREGLSINAWLVRAVAAAVDRGQPGPQREQRTARSGQRYTGWGR